jgi:hypothetical protein
VSLRGLGPAVAALLAAGCFGGPPPVVEDLEAQRFAERSAAFYAHWVGVPVDARETFENFALREYFATQAEFADYYASLATQVREAQFRNARIDRLEVAEWRRVSDDIAVVDVLLVGHHHRELIFWELDKIRSDTWRRVGATWFVVPDKL